MAASGKVDGHAKVANLTTKQVADSTYDPVTGEATVTLTFSGVVGVVPVSGTAMFSSHEVLNRPPLVDAGADQNVNTAAATCSAHVLVDGNSTLDRDDDIASWSWVYKNDEVGTNPELALDLGLGTHELKLNVSDTFGSAMSDVVKVTVSDQSDPIPECINVQRECTGVSTPVETSCTASDACDANATPENHALDSYPLGHHVYNCDATDAAGNTDSAECTIDINDSVKPVFTFVPGDLTITSCDHPNIGQAIATDLCGPVLVSSDAPDKFPLGVTVVTWYALDHGNNQVTATQRVRAVLGNDPSCCPAGTNVMVGTSGANTINGTSGSDCILGLAGIDQIDGKGGDDFISAGDGNDTVSDLAGHNLVLGGNGNDILSSGNGNDVVLGNEGVDTCNGGLGTNAVSCEIASGCTAACCATNSCGDQIPDPLACGAAYAQSSCLSLVQGSVVERNGHNWLCSNGNCRNCASDARCAPGGTGCPWGVVWTDQNACH